MFPIIRRDPVSLITNLTGLSLGLAATILLTVFIQFELSFDHHFSRADRIYRMNSIWISQGGTSEMAINLRQAYTEIPEKVAGIESAIQLYRGFQVEVSEGENRHKELELLYSDPDFFRIFDLKMLAGDPESALSEPNTVVLTQKSAMRIFGELDVVGRRQDRQSVTGVVSEQDGLGQGAAGNVAGLRGPERALRGLVGQQVVGDVLGREILCQCGG